jgi:hypothetical protein
MMSRTVASSELAAVATHGPLRGCSAAAKTRPLSADVGWSYAQSRPLRSVTVIDLCQDLGMRLIPGITLAYADDVLRRAETTWVNARGAQVA